MKHYKSLEKAYLRVLNEEASHDDVYHINGVAVHYKPEVEEEKDNSKIWHYFVDNEGKIVKNMDWSSYDYPSKEIINFWIKLGCPDRYDIKEAGAGNGIGPVDIRDLQNYAKTKV